MILIIILGPYFVHLGTTSGCPWQPYYFAAILAFIFATLQGTQCYGVVEPFLSFALADRTLIYIPIICKAIEANRKSKMSIEFSNMTTEFKMDIKMFSSMRIMYS